MGAADLLTLVRKRVNTSAVHAEAKKPFRFFLCGDPGLVAELRAMLLWGHGSENVPDDAAGTLETIDPSRRPTITGPDARCIIFLGRSGDLGLARTDLLQQLRLPIFALTIEPGAEETYPALAPKEGEVGEYTFGDLGRETLRTRFFPHLVERCKGVEVAVGRRLPSLRESVAVKLTRDAASSALKVAGASALVESVPLLGFVIGAVASAGDILAITGIQIVLMLQIGAAYGKDPDVKRMWELLPVVGGGLGWRALSRELAGFVPVAGIAIKGAIAYAGTIVVGEGVTFFYEHGKHMSKAQGSQLYEETKRSALHLARRVFDNLRR